MAIEVQCSACGAEFTFSDSHAGRLFRCRECDEELSIPSAADVDPWAEESSADNPYANTRRRRKSSSRQRSDAMPVSIIIVLVCFGINVLFSIFNAMLADAPREARHFQFLGMVIGVIITVGLATGICLRSNVVRWITVGLYVLGIFGSGCGVAMFLLNPGMQDLLTQQGQSMTYFVVTAIVGLVLNITIIACLLVSSASEWFSS